MFRSCRLACIAALFSLCGCARAAEPLPPAATAENSQPSTVVPTALDDYIARAEPNYKWEKVEEQKGAHNTVTVLKVVSQTWQNRDWTHRVEIIKPVNNDFPDTAFVLISIGSAPESLVAQLLAKQMGATVININNVPNQPLWNLREDALLSHTFQKFLQTGDVTWPLLLPMTKAVVKAMDAAQEYSRGSGEKLLEKFVVSGASKRGWVAWLVAAADAKFHPNRVTGILPLVYNNLNLVKQLPHQLESWGKYSDLIDDYPVLGMKEQLSTPRGQDLISMIDPYSYRKRLLMPKLLINGTNDAFWALDATQFYLGALPGQFVMTTLYWSPNAPHELVGDYSNVLSVAAAWFRVVANQQRTPWISIFPGETLDGTEKVFTVRLSSAEQKGKAVRFWATSSPTRDFRKAHWEPVVASINTGQYFCRLPAKEKESQYRAAFAEVEFAGEPTLRISSEIEIWKTTKVE